MHHLKGSLPTNEPSRYLVGLCSHFRRKITVEYTDLQGLAHFPWGDCVLKAQEGALEFECHAMSDENLKQLQFVLNEHIALFSRRAPMTVHWQTPSSSLV
jgi:uncharacterized protein